MSNAPHFFDEHASFDPDELAAIAGLSPNPSPKAPLIGPPPCSLHDLADLAGRLLVGWSQNSKYDDHGATIRGGALEVDEATIEIAVDAAADIYRAAAKRLAK